MSKSKLRHQLKNILNELQGSFRDNKNKRISLRLLSFLNSKKLPQVHQNTPTDIIGTYSPFGLEADWTAEFRKQCSFEFAFPSFKKGNEMEFYKSRLQDLVLSNEFGPEILSPIKNSEVICPKVFLVPALGFDRAGNRLGKGGGFYDRYFSKNKDVLKIGMAFDEQLVDEIPVEENDIPVDFIITDLEIINCHQS